MVSAKEIPPEAILLAVYLELQNGMSDVQLGLNNCKNNQIIIL